MSQNKKFKKRSGKDRKEGRTTLVVVKPGVGLVPPRMRTHLSFSKAVKMTNNAAYYTNIVFTPTAAYDIDPVIGSTTMPGFTAYSNLYRYYRVRASSIVVDFANNEVFNAFVAVIPLNSNPASNTINGPAYFGMPFVKTRPIGPLTGNNVCQIKHFSTTQKMGGVNDPEVQDDYTAAVSTTPNNEWYWGIFAQSTGANFQTGVGIDVFVRLTVEIDFHEPSVLTA